MKRKILFVDDEPRVLKGIERMLYGMRQEWEMVFVESGREALEELARQNYDVVVSDMRMPGMSGDELLEKVTNLYPQVVRIVLSGHSDRNMIMKSVRTAHQYLAKPCDSETLKETILKTTEIRALLKNDELIEIVSKMESIPSLPSLYMEIMEEIQSPDSSPKSIGSIIEKDIGMSAKILQLVNSAFFALPRKIISPAHAVSFLGLEIVKALVLSVQVFTKFEGIELKGLSLDLLWQHSLAVGQFSKKIFEQESNDQNTAGYAMIAGMLHDIGKLILITNLTDIYQKIILQAKMHRQELPEIEIQALGVTHAEIGAYILGLWGLPNLIVEAVAYHHCPSRSPGMQFLPLTTVHVSNIIEHQLFPNRNMNFIPASFDMDHIVRLGLKEKLERWKIISRDTIHDGENQ